MKKITLLFTTIFALAFGATVSAQSTGSTPAPGATHEYSVTPHEGNTYKWTIFESDPNTPVGAEVATISSPNANSTNITWASDLATESWYYVKIVESNPDGCSNIKVLPVQITASPFFLNLTAEDASCYDGEVTVTIASNQPSYNHGTATIDFTITPNNFSTHHEGYSFDLGLTIPDGYTHELPGITSGTGTITSNTVEVTNNDPVVITYTITNTNSYDNSSAANAQNFTATLAITNGITTNGVKDNGTGTSTDDTAVSRPNTSGIQTN